MTNHFLRLPSELVHFIVGDLPAACLGPAAQVCREWRPIASSALEKRSIIWPQHFYTSDSTEDQRILLTRVDGCLEWDGRAVPRLQSVAKSLLTYSHGVLHEGCQGLRSLSAVDAMRIFSPTLTTLAGLEALAAVRKLDLSHCSMLANLDALSGLRSTACISLNECSALESLEGLSGCVSLLSLSCQGCIRLCDVEGLRNLATVERTLSFEGCAALCSVEGLRSLTSVGFSVNLDGCQQLHSLAGLESLFAAAPPMADGVCTQILVSLNRCPGSLPCL